MTKVTGTLLRCDTFPREQSHSRRSHGVEAESQGVSYLEKPKNSLNGGVAHGLP